MCSIQPVFTGPVYGYSKQKFVNYSHCIALAELGSLVRKWFKKITPERESILANRWIRPFAYRLTHPEIWHFNRRNVARGVALGLFVGFIVPLGQIVLAALLAATARGNLLIAAAATLVTNPLTFPPIYYAAFQTGSFLLNSRLANKSSEALADSNQVVSVLTMITSASLPTLFGLVLFATVASAVGFAAVHVGWRFSIRRQWRLRKRTIDASDAIF